MKIPPEIPQEDHAEYLWCKTLFLRAKLWESVELTANYMALRNPYTYFFERYPLEHFKTWNRDIELLWMASDEKPIIISPEDAGRLKRAIADSSRQLPPPKIRTCLTCYELPQILENNLGVEGSLLTSVIVAANRHAIGAAWRFDDGSVINVSFKWPVFMEHINQGVSLSRGPRIEDITDPLVVASQFHKQFLLAYHLYNGLDALREYTV